MSRLIPRRTGDRAHAVLFLESITAQASISKETFIDSGHHHICQGGAAEMFYCDFAFSLNWFSGGMMPEKHTGLDLTKVYSKLEKQTQPST